MHFQGERKKLMEDILSFSKKLYFFQRKSMFLLIIFDSILVYIYIYLFKRNFYNENYIFLKSIFLQ